MRAGRALASLSLAAALAVCGGEPPALREAPALPERPAADLQRMIELADPGSRLLAPAARYVGALVIDRPVELVAEPGTVLDGGGEGSVVTILSPRVTLRGFAIRGSGPGPVGAPSGVLVEGAGDVRLEDLTISDCYLGITVREARGVVIRRVAIRGRSGASIAGELHAVAPGAGGGGHASAGGDAGSHDAAGAVPAGDAGALRGDGIWLWNAVGAVVRDGRIEGVRDGIYLSYGTGSLIQGNTISDGRYAIHDMYAGDLVVRGNVLRGNLSGIVLMYGGPVLLEGNRIVESGSPPTGFGVLVKDAGDVRVVGNELLDNRVGLHVDDAGRTGGAGTLVEGNLIGTNQVGALLYPSADPTFTGNAFVENVAQVVLGGTGATQASWTRDGRGNHWSDYAGFDADADGVGDVPYAEGGRVSELVARSPVLLALASGPAFRLLAAVDERWVPAEPVVLDERPLLRPGVPMGGAPAMGGRAPLAAAGTGLAGTGLAALGLLGLVAGRRSRRGAARA